MTSLKRSFRPQLELLENRSTPAVAAFQWGSSLIIRGDAGDDVINIIDQGNGTVTANITGTSGSDSVIGSNILTVTVYANGGDDTVNYNLATSLVQRRNLYLYLGYGDDIANLNVGGVTSGNLYAVVSGYAGNDRVMADFGAIDNSFVNLFSYLGYHDDNATVRFNNAIDRSVVNLHLDAGPNDDKVNVDLGQVFDSQINLKSYLQGGNDTMNAALNGHILGVSNVALNTWDSFGNDLTTYQATGVHIDDFATLSMRTYSYTGLDQADVSWQGRLDGRLNVNLAGGWMSDTLSANLNVNENSDGDLFASVIGWWQPDVLTLNIYEEDFSLNSLVAYVDGGWFTTDTINATGNVSTFNT